MLHSDRLLVVFCISLALFTPAWGKTVFVRPPYDSGGNVVQYGLQNGVDYDNALPGPIALNAALAGGRLTLSPGDTVAFLGGQFLYNWYDARNDLVLLVDNIQGAEGADVVFTGKVDGYPDGVFFGLYRQNFQAGAVNSSSAWSDESLWLKNIQPVGESLSEIDSFYNEYTLSGNAITIYGDLVDLNPQTNAWRYYKLAESWDSFVSSQGGTYYKKTEEFLSPFTGTKKSTPRIWVKPFSDLTQDIWADRAVMLGTIKAFSSIDIKNAVKHVAFEDLKIFFAGHPNGSVVSWKTPSTPTEHISFERCTIWSNAFMESVIFEPANVSYLTIADSDLGYAKDGIVYFFQYNLDSNHIRIQRNMFHHAGGNLAKGNKDWPILPTTVDAHAIGHQGGSQDILIEDNAFYLVGTAIETHSDQLIDGFHILRNLFYKVGRRYVGNVFTSGRSIVISGNQISVDKRTDHHIAYNIAVESQGLFGTNQSSLLYVYNNAAINVGEGFLFDNGNKPIKAIFTNNIVYGLDTLQPAAWGYANSNPQFLKFTSGVAGSYISARNNLFFDSGFANGFTFIDSATHVVNGSLPAFVTSVEASEGSFSAFNLFEDPGLSLEFESTPQFPKDLVFNVSSVSPLSGAGAELDPATYSIVDFFGRSRTGAPFSIGPAAAVSSLPTPKNLTVQ
jgi:hypothetical protein